jgi:DNA helicase HerA-like ATPase
MSVIGQTGSGKTTLTASLVQHAITRHYPVAILDTKGEEKFNGLHPITKLAKITRDTDVIVYRPDLDELREDLYDAFLLKMFYRRRSGIVLINEVSSLGTPATPGKGLLALIARGRHHLVRGSVVRTTLIGETQRPRQIPRQVLVECTSFAVFRLADKDDRVRVAAFTHPALAGPPDVLADGRRALPHTFWYFMAHYEQPQRVALRLAQPKGRAA